MKLYSKTTILTLPLIVIPVMILAWVAYSQIIDTTKKIIIDEIDSSSKQIKSNYYLNIKTAISNIGLFSNHSTIIQYAITEDIDIRYTLLQLPLMKQFSRFNKSFPGYHEFRFIYPDGQEDIRWTKDYITNKDEDESKNSTFIKMSEQNEAIFYTLYKNPDTKKPSLWFSKRVAIRNQSIDPISRKPKLRGYLVITSNIDFLTKQISEILIGKNGYFIIVNGLGQILTTPTTQPENPFGSSIYKKINLGVESWEKLKGASQLIKTTLNNNHYLIGSKKIDSDIYLVSILPENEFNAGTQKITTAVIIITTFSIIISAILILFVLNYILIKPINILNNAAKKISIGKLEPIKNIESDDEIGELTQSFNEMTYYIKESNEQIKFLAYHDNLTGLPNRLMFKEYLEPVLARAKRNNEYFSILFLDLDDFKRVNDSLGHKAGDKLLQTVAMRLSKSVRHEDYITTRNSDSTSNVVARLGGDEFIILLADIHKPYIASKIAERILTELEIPEAIDGHEIHMSTSIGISIFPDDGNTADTLIKNADLAMYNAKELGKNTYCNYSSELNKKAKIRLSMENRLRKAVDNGDFVLHYQPQINPITNKISGVESLIRWNDPEHGLIPPIEFIPIAEDSGLVLKLTDWVLHESCRQNKEWQDMGLPPIIISSNISGIDIARRDLKKVINNALSANQLSPEYLEVELTESVMMSTDIDVVSILREINEIGVSIALDDFGTGYSSLNYLLRFPIQTLKIDRSFIIDIEHNRTKASITSSIIEMAHTLDLKVIAEGIEKEEQLKILKQHKCDVIQGFYYSKPVESQFIVEMLNNDSQLI